MKIFKTLVSFDDDSDLCYADSIEHEGQMWLVPEWIDVLSEGCKMPKRLICLNTMPHERLSGGSGSDFVLRWPIPRCIFDGQIPNGTKTKYLIVERPDIRIPTSGKTQWNR